MSTVSATTSSEATIAAAASPTQAVTKQAALGKNDFLNLLVA